MSAGRERRFDDWEPVTLGDSGTEVRRSKDGNTYVKIARTPTQAAELRDERDRLAWLATTAEVIAARVLDWFETTEGGSLVASAVQGVPASSVPVERADRAASTIVDFLDVLHALPTAECPFDRRLTATLALARENLDAGRVDEDDFDDERRGWSAHDVLDTLLEERDRAARLEPEDMAVCHGDLSLPNVVLDPVTLVVTGIVDVGRLGVADRHLDLALLTRSMAAVDLNPSYGRTIAEAVTERTEADPWRLGYYRALDEMF
ncbi:APH(3'') family aminoglycoside O-phosphotransferase [Georgenia halophila]|uniref:APH(3'') family aminoglycoside O-phosphotransferase n=1 Tax=Georgenia halophila TaxID=620889 RepID=A0ABP8L9K8_9MICO